MGTVGVWSTGNPELTVQEKRSKELNMERSTASLLVLMTVLSSLMASDFTVANKRDMSKSDSWRCGFFLASAEDGLPRATYFVVQQHFPIQCPAKIFRKRNMERDCKIQGQSWGAKWNPEEGGARGRNGDRICQIASKELGTRDIPNKEYPLVLQIAAFYNHCGNKEWIESKYRRTERICCEDGLYVSCRGRL